jgi:hypothetical protein
MLRCPPNLPLVRMALAACVVMACFELAHAEGGDGGGGGGGGAGAGGGASGAGAGAGAGAGTGGAGAGAGSSAAGHGHSEGGEGEGAPAASSAGASASPGAAASPGASRSAPSAGPAAGSLRGIATGGGAPGNARATRPSRQELQFEQNLARDAVSQGQIQPLDSILGYAESAAPGTVLSARFKKDDAGVWTYTLVILSPGGRYREVVVNAKTGAIVRIR